MLARREHAPPPRGETTRHDYGNFRRRIRVVNLDERTTIAGLEDDFHHFALTLRHDGITVTRFEATAHRWPWTTCPDAGDQLTLLHGMRLSPRCLAVHDVADATEQCTHQFELAGLAVAHACRGETLRQYDVEVPFGAQSGGPHRVLLSRNGVEQLGWTLDGPACLDPEPYASAPWRRGFSRWADANLPVDDAEAAIVLRRCCDLSFARGADLKDFPRVSQYTASMGICYTFQPDVAAVSIRQLGTIRDWDGHVDDMLRDGPHAPSAPDLALGPDRTAP